MINCTKNLEMLLVGRARWRSSTRAAFGRLCVSLVISDQPTSRVYTLCHDPHSYGCGDARPFSLGAGMTSPTATLSKSCSSSARR
jgi:hypothetical protein